MNTSVVSLITELSEGNPGAMRVLLDLMGEYGESILLRVRDLKSLRGPAIWELFKDECGQDYTKTAEQIVSRWDKQHPEVKGI